MSRTIPVSLQTHLDGEVRTLCRLLKVTTKNGDVLGFTDHSHDVSYDDGTGALAYSAPQGFMPSDTSATADMGVDNAEAMGLLFDSGISEQLIEAGYLDDADFRLYLVNYVALDGHVILMTGKLGQARTRDGLSYQCELRSLSQQLKQTIVELDSLTCRARFGSQAGEERFPCGFDASTLWVAGVVTSVGVESMRTFIDSALTGDDDLYVPGIVEWLTGNNAGKTLEVESFASGQVSLAHTTAYPISTGDTFRIRRDCNKQARDASKGCKHWFGTSWGLRFRGEPDIPLGDEAALSTPGAAQSSTGSYQSGGSVETWVP